MALICRMCLSTIINENCHNLDKVFPDTSKYPQLKDRCKMCVPEMDYDIITNAVICGTCYEKVDLLFQFKLKCFNTETLIHDIIKRTKNNKTSIDLDKLVHTNSNEEDPKLNTKPIPTNVVELVVLDENEELYGCASCSYTTASQRDLVRHLRTHSIGNAIYKCRKCNYSTQRKRNFQLHMQIHSNKCWWKCKLCNYKSVDKIRVHRHFIVHTGVKPYKCILCNRRFAVKGNLEIHVKVHTDVQSFKCTECSYSSAYRTHFKAHLRTHTDEKLYKCNLCDYSARQNYLLRAHLNSHRGRRPYFKCDQCNRCFDDHSNLRTHKRRHAREKSQTCNICGKSFDGNFLLTRHLKTHSNERLYKCIKCDYRTKAVSKPVWLEHMKQNHMPFPCSGCGFRAVGEANLREHVTRHPDCMRNKCDICGEMFLHSFVLEEHKRSFH